MNDQKQTMKPPQMIPPPPVLVQTQALNPRPPVLGSVLSQKPQMLSQSQAISQRQPLMMANLGGYNPWTQQLVDLNTFKKPQNLPRFSGFAPSKPRGGGGGWKGKKQNKDQRRMDKNATNKPKIPKLVNTSVPGIANCYKTPNPSEIPMQNRGRKHYHPKRKNNRFAPYAPRNTTSFIIRAKKAGGIASLISPCPVTPAVLPTPIFSPSREVLGDMAKEEWGVDGYGSMNGLIRLRSPGNEVMEGQYEEEEGNESSESDVEEHVEMERRLDHDLSRFEMIYPSYVRDSDSRNMDGGQGMHIAQLEEENLNLKERLFLMERELRDVTRRLLALEREHGHGGNPGTEDVNEEVVDNIYEHDENEDGSCEGSEIGTLGCDNIENEGTSHVAMDGTINTPSENADMEDAACYKPKFEVVDEDKPVGPEVAEPLKDAMKEKEAEIEVEEEHDANKNVIFKCDKNLEEIVQDKLVLGNDDLNVKEMP